MTVEELMTYVGEPAPGTEVQRERVGDLDLACWQSELDGPGDEPGWWWAASCGGVVFALGHTSGDCLARNVELGTKVAAQLHQAHARQVPS